MSEAAVEKKGPLVMELEPGDYWYCACGRSGRQPFCDGSHRGTAFMPMKFTVEKKKTVGLCGCRRGAGQPFCDGTHKKL